MLQSLLLWIKVPSSLSVISAATMHIILEKVTYCYCSTFLSLMDPIILDPAIASFLMQTSLGYDSVMQQNCYIHMLKFYKWMVQAMAISRVLNSKHFAWWGAIGSAIMYGQKETNASKWMTNLWSFTVCYYYIPTQTLCGLMKVEHLHYSEPSMLLCARKLLLMTACRSARPMSPSVLCSTTCRWIEPAPVHWTIEEEKDTST